MGSLSFSHGGKSTRLTIPTPRFIVLHSDTTQLTTVSPFLVAKTISGMIGSVTSVKKLASGDLLVNTASDAQSKNLLKLKNLAHIPITCTPHPTLNSCKGVIYCPDIVDIPESEILDGMKEQKVESVKQIIIKKNEVEEKSPLFVLTFSTTTLPSKVFAGYISLNVRPYIPNPMRCFLCQKYGHNHKLCRGTAVCANCGSPEHKSDECTAAKPCCVNCSGDHPAYVKTCPKYLFEKEVQRVKTLDKLSYPEARKKVLETTTLMPPVAKKTYAAIATKQTTPSQTQTARTNSTPLKPTISSTPTNQTNQSNTPANTPVSEPSTSNKPNPNLDRWIHVALPPGNNPPANPTTDQNRMNLAAKRLQEEQIKNSSKFLKQLDSTSDTEPLDPTENKMEVVEQEKRRHKPRSRDKSSNRKSITGPT